jgi:hypothetical protein
MGDSMGKPMGELIDEPIDQFCSSYNLKKNAPYRFWPLFNL